MSSPSDAAPDRPSAAGEETKRRLSRKRVTVITATALSLLEACGLEPSPARSEKTAGKGKKATQGEPPAEKASADGLEERQAAGSASSRERNGGRKKRSAPDRAPREAADAVPQEDASQGVAATKAALPEIPPVTIDGIFGSATRDAVIAAQRRFGLPQTGVVNAETWDEIYDQFAGIEATSWQDPESFPYTSAILGNTNPRARYSKSTTMTQFPGNDLQTGNQDPVRQEAPR